MPAPHKYVVFYRNLKGHYDLMLFLCKWDRNSRKEMIVTFLVFILFGYSLATWNNVYDVIAMTIEASILVIQLGWPPSILPADYRPFHDGVKYSVQTSTHIAYDELSFPMARVYPAPAEAALDFYNPMLAWMPCEESPLVSHKVNDFLMRRKTLPYREEMNETNYIRSRHQLRYIAIRVANKVQNTRNLVKLEFYGMADALMGDAPVIVRKSFYYNALLTAEAFRSRIFRDNLLGEKEVYTDLTTYFPVKKEMIDGQESMRFIQNFHKYVAGRIGVTTLMLTENRRVAMFFQGSSKVVGADKVNLGGSGSVDHADLERAGHPDDLREVITYAMARELCEAAGMEKWLEVVRRNTTMTGFFRWIDRCGHPEFIGITHARNIPFSKQHAVDGDEVIRYDEIPVTIETLDDFCKVMDYIRDHKINVALASLMALHRMTVIAGYAGKGASAEQKKIYQTVSAFVLG